MKKAAYTFATCLLIAFSSCKKEETPTTNNPEVTGNNYVKTVTFNDTLLINAYAYDASWRIISSEGDDSFTVDYATGTVTYASETGQLNSNGYLVSKSDGTNYTYDNNGYLISESDDVSTTQYFWSAEGNLTQEITTYASGVGVDTTALTYVYDLSKLNPIRGTEKMLEGKSSKNIITSISYTSSFGSSSTSTFSYIYDSKGRIAVMNQTEGTSQFKFSLTYFD